MSATTATVPPAEAAAKGASTLGAYVRSYRARLRGGEMGALPAVLGLLVLVTGFSILRPRFFTPLNFANLITQGATVTIIAMGLVFVLLLGEIDLSAGYTSGVCASIMTVVLVKHGWPWYFSILAAMVTGAVIGTVLGFLVAKVGIPSFVVTLAAFLAFQGLELLLLGEGNIISVHNKVIVAINGTGRVGVILSYVLWAMAVVGFATVQFVRRYNRRRRELVVDPLSIVALRIGAVAVVLGAIVYVLNIEQSRNPAFFSLRGVPVVTLVLAGLLLVWTFVLSRTAYGRHIYAVGGNREAARRAGIPVDRIRISAFIICSTMASIGGIVAVSRANSVDPNTGGSDVLLYAVGAAVIGGTSLFGGKGRVLDAVLGGAVVAVIQNGMGLMGYGSGIKYIVTGVVLLLAAGVDALSRRRAAAVGLR
jgi:D-xylose transport system permease protein